MNSNDWICNIQANSVVHKESAFAIAESRRFQETNTNSTVRLTIILIFNESIVVFARFAHCFLELFVAMALQHPHRGLLTGRNAPALGPIAARAHRSQVGRVREVQPRLGGHFLQALAADEKIHNARRVLLAGQRERQLIRLRSQFSIGSKKLNFKRTCRYTRTVPNSCVWSWHRSTVAVTSQYERCSYRLPDGVASLCPLPIYNSNFICMINVR